MEAESHDFWLDADTLRPAAGSTVKLFVRGGHYFPSSSVAPSDRVIKSFTVSAGKESFSIESRTEGRQRTAEITVRDSVTHRVDLVLQRPGTGRPDAYATLFIVPNGAVSDSALYAREEGLEIVPLKPFEAIRRNEPAALEVRQNGKPVSAKIQLLSAEGGSVWVEAGPGRPAEFRPAKAGRYLAQSEVDGQTATLVFEVLP